jgi:hypothetical protein
LDDIGLQLASPVRRGGVAWGDYDNDGDLDLLISGDIFKPIIVYRNDGDFTFTDIHATLTGAPSQGIVRWVDYDGDGLPDIFVTGQDGEQGGIFGTTYSAKIYRNQGNGTFTDIHANLVGVEGGDGAVAWGDYNNDHRPDLLITGPSSSGSITKLYRNDGNGVFTEVPGAINTLSTSSLEWGDYNKDGLADILTSDASVYRNNGDGTFTEISPGLSASGGTAAWGDYNNDGFPDILVTGQVGNGLSSVGISKILRNNGNGTFTDINAGLLGLAQSMGLWVDIDNDGSQDVYLEGTDIAGRATVRKVYRNNGDGSFSDLDIAIVGGNSLSTAAWADADGDGDQDLFLGPSGGTGAILGNSLRCAISGTVTSGGRPLSATTITISGDASGSATSSGTGFYKFSGLAPGSYALNPSRGDYAFSPVTINVSNLNGANSKGDNFAGTVSIGGRITSGGIGLSGVVVTLGGDSSASAPTDGSGTYVFSGLTNGSYTLAPSKGDYVFSPSNASVILSDANATGKDFVGTLSISGRVTSGGAGLAGVTVSLGGASSATTTTDLNGMYAFPGLANGDYTLIPSKGSYSFAPVAGQVTLQDKSTTDKDFSGGFTISGKVTKNGQPVAKSTIGLTGSMQGSAMTDQDGKYSFNLVPLGEYVVSPTDTSISCTPVSTPVSVTGQDVDGIDFVAANVGVTIDGAAIYTNNPVVSLGINPPAGSTTIDISNDGGFGNSQTFPVASVETWRLLESGDERLPKTVYVRFAGNGIDPTQTFTDDIILDQTNPIVDKVGTKKGRGFPDAGESSLSVYAKSKPVPVLTLSFQAHDNASGVAMVQIASSQSGTAPWQPYKNRITIALPRKKTLWVRAQDGAGNDSAWKKVAVK